MQFVSVFLVVVLAESKLCVQFVSKCLPFSGFFGAKCIAVRRESFLDVNRSEGSRIFEIDLLDRSAWFGSTPDRFGFWTNRSIT